MADMGNAEKALERVVNGGRVRKRLRRRGVGEMGGRA